MMIFVAVFILQWWTFIVYTAWTMVSDPPPTIFILAVIFINLGGIYNSIAYTIIRRKLQNQKRQNPVTSGGAIDSITKTIDVNSSVAAARVVSAPRAVHVLSGVPEVLPDVLRVSSDVLDDPVTKAWSVPPLPDSDVGEKQDADQILIHIHI